MLIALARHLLTFARFRGPVLLTLVAGALAAWRGANPSPLPAPERDDAAQGPRATETEPAGPQYSPFVVDVAASGVPFHHISFKDVGMSTADDAERQLAYESLAEAVSLELRGWSEEPVGSVPLVSADVRHDGALLDPDQHLACEGGHVYVDLWQSGGDGGSYGFSLWSGCGEDDRFAYEESAAESASSFLASMDPLAQRIAESLREAVDSGCFQRSC